MFSFLAWIFWLAVFLGAVVLMFGALVCDMEADDQKKVNEENEVDEIENYLNTWPTTGIFISSLLAAILSSWWMGFLNVLIFFFILLWFSLVYKTLSFFGFEFNNNNKVNLKGIDDDNEKLFTIKGEYQALSNKIIIKYKNLDNSDEEITINRKTLKIIGSSNSSCKPINKSSYIDNKLKFALDKLIGEKSSENKF